MRYCSKMAEFLKKRSFFRTIGHPEEIAQQIALYLRKRPQLKALYIAAPLEEADLIENIRKELNGEFPIFTGETLLQYMFDTYPNCQWMKVFSPTQLKPTRFSNPNSIQPEPKASQSEISKSIFQLKLTNLNDRSYFHCVF